MFGKKLIAALAALIFIPVTTMAIGKHVDVVPQKKLFSDKPIFDAKEEASITLAQNDKRNQEESEKAESDSETDESGVATDDDKQSSEDESKPLKPFVPSEQIAGEQAVDFPADI